MSESDRSLSFAVGVIVCLVVVWALGAGAGAYYQAERDSYQQNEAKPYSGPLKPDEFWGTHSGSPETYKAICQSPKDQGQADLCQEWRSANYAEQGVNYTLVSLLFGLAGLVGVGITVFYSIRATRAATSATEAAVEANKIARDISTRELRAYVAPTSPTIRNLVVGQQPQIIYRPRNSGQTPAFNFTNITQFKTITEGSVHTAKIKFSAASIGGEGPTVDLPAGEPYIEQISTLPPLPQSTYDQLMSGEMKIVWAGLLTYRDLFGRTRRTIFRYYFDPQILNGGTASLRPSYRQNRSS